MTIRELKALVENLDDNICVGIVHDRDCLPIVDSILSGSVISRNRMSLAPGLSPGESREWEPVFALRIR